MARSGTSMTSGIFYKHGAWSGICRGPDERNPKGFFENTAIKKLLKKWYGVDLLHGKFPEKEGFRHEVEKILELEGYQDGPWFVKHSALYWRAWSEFKPKFVLVRRNIASTVEANVAIRFNKSRYSSDEIATITTRHHDEMDKIDGVNVYTDDLIKGYFSSIKRAVEACGLDYDEEIVKDFVEPEFWHY